VQNEAVRRICILGTSGSGKTTLGREAARRLGIVSIDIDELNWEPGWISVPEDELRVRLEQAMEAPAWVTSGNYNRLQEIHIVRADTLVWLDYSLPVILGRMLRRTLRRVVFKEACCNGNYETWAGTFSRESVVLWLLKTYRKRREQCTEMFANPEFSHLNCIRHRSPRETRKWLEELDALPKPPL